MRLTGVIHEQHRIGFLYFFPRFGNAYLLHLVGAVAQPGGIEYVQRHAVNLNGLSHHVPGGASDWRNDCQLSASQRVKQRALTGIGLTRNHDCNAFAQQHTLLCLVHDLLELRLQTCQLTAGVCLL